MTTDRLREHYGAKYADEAHVAEPPTATPLRLPYPLGRIEAACAALPDLIAGKNVLELGSGDGAVAHSLAVGGVPFTSYTLGDISQPRLDGIAKRLSDERFRFRMADADELSELGETYDAVVMIALIEHLIDPIRSMTSVRATLAPGGFVYIDTPNVAKWTRRLKLALGRFPSTASADEGLRTYGGDPADLLDEGHLHYFTFRSLEVMLTRRCGFTRVEPVPYAPERRPFGARLGTQLAQARPQLFSELACVAYA
ncbi:MAG TPA: class I SAM-dependent methyltransferase [Mycobacteriales bacterium]|nr:class I SAM-dependent methyltransferase [Mycobacteriales bacterium]